MPKHFGKLQQTIRINDQMVMLRLAVITAVNRRIKTLFVHMNLQQ